MKYRSDSSIVPMEDRSHAETVPSDPVLTRYNTVGDYNRPRDSGYIGNLKLKPRATITLVCACARITTAGMLHRGKYISTALFPLKSFHRLISITREAGILKHSETE